MKIFGFIQNYLFKQFLFKQFLFEMERQVISCGIMLGYDRTAVSGVVNYLFQYISIHENGKWVRPNKLDFCRKIEQSVATRTSFEHDGKRIRLIFYKNICSGEFDVDSKLIIEPNKKLINTLRYFYENDYVDTDHLGYDKIGDGCASAYNIDTSVFFPHDRCSMITMKEFQVNSEPSLIKSISIKDVRELLKYKRLLIKQDRILPEYTHATHLDMCSNKNIQHI
jgi:hypothetical protein